MCPVLFTQFACEITEGEAGEEIWSSVNFLFFISISLIKKSTERTNRLGKALGDPKI